MRVMSNNIQGFILDLMERIAAYTDVDICSEENAEAYDALDGEIQDLIQTWFGMDLALDKMYDVTEV